LTVDHLLRTCPLNTRPVDLEGLQELVQHVVAQVKSHDTSHVAIPGEN
jgi:hypothetical protein